MNDKIRRDAVKVKRFDFGTEYRGSTGVPAIVEKVDGRYVRYIDYEALLEQHRRDSAELRRLCAERDKYRAQAAHSESVCDAYLKKIRRAEITMKQGDL